MITGATGFIGSHVLAALPQGFDVWTPPHDEVAASDYILPVADIIIHAAGYAAPSLFMKNPIDTVQVNTSTVIRLMEHLAPGGTFLFCSSSAVYTGLTHPATENEIGTTTPYHPRASYIEGKRCGETIVNAYREQGIRAASARIGLTYGPGTKVHDARVLNQFIEKALTEHRIDLADDGSATVTYAYVADVAKMLWQVVLNGTQAVYNVGGVCSLPVVDLALQIGSLIGAGVFVPANRLVSASQAQMNLARYYEEFGKPEYTAWKDGLQATIEYQKGLYR
jgi:UDP-glucuronate decarboxylase